MGLYLECAMCQTDTAGNHELACPYHPSNLAAQKAEEHANVGEWLAENIMLRAQLAEIKASHPAKWSEDDTAYIIDIAGVSAHGDTPAAALAEFTSALTLVIESLTDRKAAELVAARGEGAAAILSDIQNKFIETLDCLSLDGTIRQGWEHATNCVVSWIAPDTTTYTDTRKEERAKVLEEAAKVAEKPQIQQTAFPDNPIAAGIFESSLAVAREIRSLAQDKE